MGKKKSPPASTNTSYDPPYKTLTVEGCTLYNPIHIKNTDFLKTSWKGTCKNGLAEGTGWFTPTISPRGTYIREVFIEFKNGKMVGDVYFVRPGGQGFTNLKDEKVNCLASSQCQRLSDELKKIDLKTTYKTTNNCSFRDTYFNDKIFREDFFWAGACDNGIAEGLGWLQISRYDDRNANMGILYLLVEFHDGIRSNNYMQLTYDILTDQKEDNERFFLQIDEVGQQTIIKKSDCVTADCEKMKIENLPGSPEVMARKRADAKRNGNNSSNGSGNIGGTRGNLPPAKSACDLDTFAQVVNAYGEKIPYPTGMCESGKAAAILNDYSYKALLIYCPSYANNEYGQDLKSQHNAAVDVVNHSCSDTTIKYDNP